MLNNGKFYAYPQGHEQDPVIGTRSEVEKALGACAAKCANPEGKRALKAPEVWDVILTFQYPAWDEKEGIRFEGIVAQSKSEAIRIARHHARNDGHTVGGCGRYWFRAVEPANK